MADEATEAAAPERQLTLEDPVDADTLKQIEEVHNSRMMVAEQFLECEQEKMRLLAVAHRLDQQRNAIYEKLMLDRGIANHEQVEIDASTGKIALLSTSLNRQTSAPADDPPPDDPPPAP